MKSSPSYNLGKILELVEQREKLNVSLRLISPPTLIIEDTEGNPMYKICMSPFGDFLIYTNRHGNSVTKMMTSVTRMEDFYEDFTSNREVYMSYIQAAAPNASDLLSNKKYTRGGDRIEAEMPTSVSNKAGKKMNVAWRLVFALPVSKSLEFIDFLYKIFKDDLCTTESTPELSSEGKGVAEGLTARIRSASRWEEDNEIPDIEEEGSEEEHDDGF